MVWKYTNEQSYTWGLPTPIATCPTVRPRWPCQRGSTTSSTPQLPREPHPGLVPPHPLGLQPWGTHSDSAHLKCWTKSNGPGSGSRYTSKEWGLHPPGGLSSHSKSGVLERSCQNQCTMTGQETGCRFLTSCSSISEGRLVESSSKPPQPTTL